MSDVDALTAELERAAAEQQRFRALLCERGQPGGVISLERSAGRELLLTAALPNDTAAAEAVEQRLGSMGWSSLDAQTMMQDLAATHRLPGDASDVVRTAVDALVDGFGGDATGAAFTIEPHPPTLGEWMGRVLGRFGGRRER